MAAPIRDSQNNVIGVLAGAIDLDKPNFLDRMGDFKVGQKGDILLVSPQGRMIVTATEKSRIFEQLPPAGVSPALDKFINGGEGNTIFVNPKGVEVLVSVKRVPVAGWYVAVILPTADAFAPVQSAQRRVLLATCLLTILAAVVTGWVLRRQLSPLIAAAKSLGQMAETSAAPTHLPVVRNDEVGRLSAGFNHLVDALADIQPLFGTTIGRQQKPDVSWLA